jgi:UMF1 family MFS transporter
MAVTETWKPTRQSTAAWVLYDLANTIFAFAVGSRYFAPWVVDVQDGRDGYVSIAAASAMVIVIVTAPWVGARSDHRGRRVPTLIAATLVTVAATALLATWGLVPSLILFAIATVGFNLGAVVYDAMLPDVSTPETRGRVSGLGVSVGYIGSFVGLGAGVLLLDRYGYAAVFRAVAVLFLLFALPSFLFIRERPRPPTPGPPPRLAQALTHLRDAWRRARATPPVARFLVGRFLYTDAINTVLLFVAVFATEEIGFSDSETDILVLLAILGAMAGGVLAGRLVDVWGPRTVLNGVLYLWMVALGFGALAAAAGWNQLGWLLGIIGGLALGGTWASDRAYMARLSPPQYLGEFYGLYATAGRFATILGPLVWALVVDVLGLGRVAAIGVLVLYLVAARVVLQPVREPAPAG